MTPSRHDLMDQGYTWDEAEDLLQQLAEDYADAERDRLAEASLFPERE